jgi:hypothetical protein
MLVLMLVGCVLLFLILGTLFRNSARHQAAMAMRAVRAQEFREQVADENSRLHTVYNREHIRQLRKEHGFLGASRIAHEQLKGTTRV